MAQLDEAILLWIQDNLRNDVCTYIMKFITMLGDAGIVWIIFTIICLLIYKYRKIGCLSAIALLGSLLINNLLIKNLIARVRPYEAVQGLQRLIEAQSDYSFPSGHTGASFAAAVIFYLYMPKKFGIPAIVLAVLIAFSRLYLGVHYVTDVVAGAGIGIAIAFLIWRVETRASKRIDF